MLRSSSEPIQQPTVEDPCKTYADRYLQCYTQHSLYSNSNICHSVFDSLLTCCRMNSKSQNIHKTAISLPKMSLT